MAARSPWQTDGFRRFLAARMISIAGSALTYVALPVLTYETSHSPLLTALVISFEGVAYVLVGLLAGALADRWDRRRIMVGCDLMSALVLASLPVAAAAGHLSLVHIVFAAAFAPVWYVFFDAANLGALPTLVGREGLAAANGAMLGWGAVIKSAVPAMGAALLAAVSPPVLLALDAVTFAVSALLLFSLKTPLSGDTQEHPPLTLSHLRREIVEGVLFLGRHPHVRAMSIVSSLQSVAGAAFIGQVVVWADQRLGIHQGDPRLGALFASWGAGGLAAALVTPVLARRWGTARVTLIAVPVSAGLTVASALSPTWLVASAMAFAWGMVSTIAVINAMTYRQKVTPPALMSRVTVAGRMLSFGAGSLFGALLGGMVAEARGPVAGMLAGATAGVVASLSGWLSPLRTAPASELPL